MRVTKYKTKLTVDGKAELTKELSVNYPNIQRQMKSPVEIDKFAREFLKIHENTDEYLYMLVFNNKMILTSVFEVSHGNVNSSIFGVREIMQKALLANAISIIMIHNHPSGDPTPSAEDIKVTEKLAEAGNIIGVQVLDHLIIGRPNYVSLKERGIL